MSNTVKELTLLLPDSLLFGSFIFGIGTLSVQHSVLFFSLLESLLVLVGLNNVFSFINGKELTKCHSKLHTLLFEELVSSPSANNVSYGVYLLSFASSYFLSSYYNLQNELEVLDPSYTNTLTILGISFVLFFYSMLRIMFSCDSLMSVLLGLFFGLLVGIVIQYQNVNIVGRDSINFLGIPLLRNKSVNGQPIYICS